MTTTVPPAATASRRFGLLGPISAERDGVAIELGPIKQRAVLALLLLEHGRVVSTDRLVDAVWGQDPPPAATASLQSYISNLRRLLRGPDDTTPAIVRRSHGYVVEVTAEELDLAGFRSAADSARTALAAGRWDDAVSSAELALGWWRGELVADLADEEWVRTAALGLEERRLGCERDLVTALVGSGRVADASALARELAHRNPLDEGFAWLLATTLHRTGRSGDALGVLRTFGQHLDDELGLEPGPALRDLQSAILHQDPALDSWPVPGPGPGPRPGDGPGDPDPATPALSAMAPTPDAGDDLVGRSEELRQVLDLWSGDGPTWLVLSGPAGIGKTRLARAAVREWCHRGGAVSVTVCPDDDALPTWLPLRQLLRDTGLAADAVDDLLRGDGSAEAGMMRFAVYERVAEALGTAARERPLLLYLDDVHWADDATLGLLCYLLDTCRERSLSFLLTARPELAGTGEGARLLTAVSRHRRSLRLSVPPLAPDDVAAIVAQVNGGHAEADGTDAEELTRRTGGNPFFVTEIARLPPDQRSGDALPEAVRLVLSRRLDVLPAHVRQVLRQASVIGEAIDLPALCALTGLTVSALAPLLDAAADEHLVVVDRGAGYAFTHALLREALLGELSPLARQAVHLDLAETLRSRRDPAGLTSRARHLTEAGALADAATTIDACRLAAIDAEGRWESEEAGRWWETALAAHDARPHESPVDRDALVTALVGAWVRSGQGQRALDLVDESLLRARREKRWDSIGHLSRMLLRLTGSCSWPSYGSDPAPLMLRLSSLEQQMADQPAHRSRVLAALAVGRLYDPDVTLPDRLSREAVEVARDHDERGALIDALLGRAMVFAGVAERAPESLALLYEVTELLGPDDDFDRVILHGLGSMASMSVGDVAAARQHVREGVELATEMRLPVSMAQLTWTDASLRHWETGDLATLERTMHAAAALHRRTQLTESLTQILVAVSLRWEQGRLAEGLGLEVDPFVAPWVDAAIAVARRDPDAGDLLAAEVARPEPVMWTSHGRWTLLAHAIADHGIAELAAPMIERLTPLRDGIAHFGHLGGIGPIALAEARLRALVGDDDGAREALAVATRVSRATGARSALDRCAALRATLGADPAESPVESRHSAG